MILLFRYDCKNAQFLSGPDTQYNYHMDNNRAPKYWMITKCHPGYTNMSVVQRCISPGIDGSLDSIIPVTLVTTDEVFLNKFCVLCNNNELHDDIIYWNIDIYADNLVTFPEKNLLNRIKFNRENIFFTPPKYIQTPPPCNLPVQRINKCNDKGISKTYCMDIELACEPLNDTYNLSHETLFCYICNKMIEEHEYSENVINCDEEPIYDKERPKYNIPVSRNLALGLTSKEQLKCGRSQFYDKASVSRFCENPSFLSLGRKLGIYF